jgi:plastocyanin
LDVELSVGGDDGGGSDADYVVEVSSNVFTPDHLDIAVGETVEWINMGGFHNVDGSTDTYPDNPDSFTSGPASTDSWTYSFTFTEAGSYAYECTPHAGMGMVGTITVGSGGCTTEWACNYDASADFDDGSCTYPPGDDCV